MRESHGFIELTLEKKKSGKTRNEHIREQEDKERFDINYCMPSVAACVRLNDDLIGVYVDHDGSHIYNQNNTH